MTTQLGAGQAQNWQNVNTAGVPVVGGDSPGQNLVLRSTSNAQKGSVVVDETTHSHSPIAGALTVPNGSIGVGGNVVLGGYGMMMPQGSSVTGYLVVAGGSGYPNTATSPNAVSVLFSPPDLVNGIQAFGYATVSGGAITGVVMVVPGSGYTRVPTVTVQSNTGGSGAIIQAVLGYTSLIHNGCIHQSGYVQSITVQSGGTSYAVTSAMPTLTISKPDIPGGIQATASLVANAISGGVITVGQTSVVITNPGSGYLNAPTVTINPQTTGTPAVFVALLGNPGVKPLITRAADTSASLGTLLLDFSLTGQNVIHLVAPNNLTINFDATKGFPIGRRIEVFVRSTGATSATLTGFTATNTSTGSATMTLTNARTTKFEFTVLTGGNTVGDIFVTQVG